MTSIFQSIKTQDEILQTVFDRVKTHLLTQNAKSMTNENGYFYCKYRTSDELKCAIGCLIADEDYHSELEGSGVRVNYGRNNNFLRGSGIYCGHPRMLDLLSRLQRLHDQEDVCDWKIGLQEIAIEFSLIR